MRVLLVAYQCDRDKGSEPQVGWAMLRAAARDHEVTLLTQKASIPRLERQLAEEDLRPSAAGSRGRPE